MVLVPGLIWSFALFNKEEISWLERTVFSIGLSMALVPVSVFLANRYLNVSINFLNSIVIILVVSALPGPWLYLKQRRKD